MFGTAIHLSRNRLLWADELISYQVFSDASFVHRLQAWYRGADSGGLTYYLFFPLWQTLFGLNELSLRLFSTAGMSVALALLWAALRRYSSTFVTAIALSILFFTPPAMLWQELNGRFYGLFFAFAAWATLLFLRVAEARKPSRSLLLCVFLAHGGLVASHIFGLLFSFSLIVGSVVVDRSLRRFRWPVYLSAGAGWIFALISLPSLKASSSVVGKVFWTQRPNFAAFLYSFAGYGRVTAYLAGALLGTAIVRLLWLQVRPSPASRQHLPPLAPRVLVGAFVLAALLFFAKSQVGVSIFADRYLLPLTIATAFLLAGALGILVPPGLTASRLSGPLAGLAVLPFCVYGATRHVNYLLYPTTPYVTHVNALLRPGVPGITGLPIFPFLHLYDPEHHFLFLTDWAYADDPAHLADYSGERLMENWKRAGYLSQDILPCTVIFSRYPQVDLLLSPHHYPWFTDRVLHDPHLRVTAAGVVHEWDWVDVWHVDRISPGPPPC